ncbi:hypothetical protein AGLY_004669 [Aphis glycines]|uniref:Uncharacterized protein n=1 Tax=Aphis glycines TaxID=307491 RepID=A0A6G0TVG1_APHGL|nr:hypothetical protein AGLY_004669 [Aphis glycines]
MCGLLIRIRRSGCLERISVQLVKRYIRINISIIDKRSRIRPHTLGLFSCKALGQDVIGITVRHRDLRTKSGLLADSGPAAPAQNANYYVSVQHIFGDVRQDGFTDCGIRVATNDLLSMMKNFRSRRPKFEHHGSYYDRASVRKYKSYIACYFVSATQKYRCTVVIYRCHLLSKIVFRENKTLRAYDCREDNHMIIKQICFIMDEWTTERRRRVRYNHTTPDSRRKTPSPLDMLFGTVFGDLFNDATLEFREFLPVVLVIIRHSVASGRTRYQLIPNHSDTADITAQTSQYTTMDFLEKKKKKKAFIPALVAFLYESGEYLDEVISVLHSDSGTLNNKHQVANFMKISKMSLLTLRYRLLIITDVRHIVQIMTASFGVLSYELLKLFDQVLKCIQFVPISSSWSYAATWEKKHISISTGVYIAFKSTNQEQISLPWKIKLRVSNFVFRPCKL